MGLVISEGQVDAVQTSKSSVGEEGELTGVVAHNLSLCSRCVTRDDHIGEILNNTKITRANIVSDVS